MPVLYANRAFSTLAANITNAATSLSVAAGHGARFPTISGSNYFYATLDNNAGTVEVVKVTARSTDTFTIVRAQDGTSAQAFNAGAGVELRLVKAMIDDIKFDAVQNLTLLNMPSAAFKRSVKAATTANITLSGAQTIDGVSVVAGDRVLVKNQTTASQNGIYVASASTWTRATDADAADEIGAAIVNVDQGTANGGESWTTTFKTTDTVGTTAMNWYEVLFNNGTWAISTTGSAATLTTARTIGMTGDVTWTSASFNGSANVTGTATLANSGATAGTYTKVTVDAKGRVTAGASLAAGDVPTLNQNTTGSAATLTTTRTLWGQNFNGSANVTGNLTSVGNITGTAGVTLTATTAQLTLAATGANSVSIQTNGVERLRAYSGGGVLINDTLFVGRTNTTDEGGQINLQRASDNASMYGFDVYGSTTTPVLRLLNIANSSALLAQFDSAGNVAFTGDVRAASYNGGPLAGFRNKIINGAMEIAQRGASFSGVTQGTANFPVDRFNLDHAGHSATVTTSQSTSVPSNTTYQYSLLVTVNTADTSIAAADVFVVSQRIEGYSARHLFGKGFTLSFWVRSSKTGTHCVRFGNGVAGTNGRTRIVTYSINAANTWEFKTITVTAGLPTSGGTWNWTNGLGLTVGWALAGGTNWQTVADSWQAGDFVCTSAQVNVLDTVGNTFGLTGVQLELGSVATAFEHRPYGTELALCQRYYRFLRWQLRTYAAAGAYSYAYAQTFPVAMRAAPTLVTFTAGTGVNATITLENADSYGALFQIDSSSAGNTSWGNRVMSYSSEL